MSSLMEQLHDIEGIDAISPWPLALGWWVLIACGALILAGAIWWLRRRLRYLRSWQRDALKKLTLLERTLSPSTSMQTVVSLSEYLRRIAVRRFPRKECAGLVGNAYLEWLEVHDPKQFHWTEKGKCLIETPYAPEIPEISLQHIQELIQATKHWVY